MDPLSLTANVITVLQLTNAVITICYDVMAARKRASWSLSHVVDEMRDLRNVLEELTKAAEDMGEPHELHKTKLQFFQSLCAPDTGPLSRCRSELTNLHEQFKPAPGDSKRISTSRAIVQVIGWQWKENEVTSILERIDRCKNTILLALAADQTNLLVDIKDTMTSVNRTTLSINENVSKLLIRIQSPDLDDKSMAMKYWLSPVDPWEAHDTAATELLSGTGKWFITSDVFRGFLEKIHRGIWLCGVPGAGKTTLFANVVMHLSENSSFMVGQPLSAYFYCDFRKPASRDTVNIVGSLVFQLCSQLQRPFPDIEHAYQHSQLGHKRPSLALLGEVLRSISDYRRCILLVDAVDECVDRGALLSFMAGLNATSKNINLFLTSRDEPDIGRALGFLKRISMEGCREEMNGDIGMYIDERLNTDQSLRWLKDSVKEEIRDCLTDKSGGMFRLVQCTMDYISTLRTVRNIRQALRSIPLELAQMYESILMNIREDDVAVARKILQWLAFTALPITLDELHYAIAIEQGLPWLDEDLLLSSKQDITAICGSLVSITKQGHVRLAHMSVKDYLLSETIRNGPASTFAIDAMETNKELALDCFTHLLFEEFQNGPCDSKETYSARVTQHPFLRHASTAWTYYLRATCPSIQSEETIMSFFSAGNRQAFMSWVQVLNASSESDWDYYPRHATGLYYAASFGLADVVNNLISSGKENLDSPGSRFGGTALHGAVCRNHTMVVKALLESGADPNRGDFDGVTPLHTAAAEGYVDSMCLLLKFGASRDARDRKGETPTEWAVKADQETSHKILEGSMSKHDIVDGGEIKIWTGWVGTYISDVYSKQV